jgi:dimethylaniline monooxygenase (N-oxide forming)
MAAFWLTSESGTPPYCSAKTMENYIESYVDHYDLRPHFRLNTAVSSIALDDTGKWQLDFKDGNPPQQYFDKVVVATGPHVKPMLPVFEGQELFKGQIIHSMAFKRYDDSQYPQPHSPFWLFPFVLFARDCVH